MASINPSRHRQEITGYQQYQASRLRRLPKLHATAIPSRPCHPAYGVDPTSSNLDFLSMNSDSALGHLADLMFGDFPSPLRRHALISLELASGHSVNEHLVDLFQGPAFGL